MTRRFRARKAHSQCSTGPCAQVALPQLRSRVAIPRLGDLCRRSSGPQPSSAGLVGPLQSVFGLGPVLPQRAVEKRTERIEVLVDPVEDALDLDLLGEPGVDRRLIIAEIGAGEDRGRELLPKMAALFGALQAERDQTVVKAVIIRELAALRGMGDLVEEIRQSCDEHLEAPSLVVPTSADPIRVTITNDHLGAAQGEGPRAPGEELRLSIAFPWILHLPPE